MSWRANLIALPGALDWDLFQGRRNEALYGC